MSRELLQRALDALKSCAEISHCGERCQEYNSYLVEESIEEIESEE